MDTSRRVLAALILGGVGLLLLFLGGAPVSLVLHITALFLTVQAFQCQENKPLCLVSFAVNGIAALLALVFSVLSGLFHTIF